MAAPDGTGPMFSGWELWYIVPVAFIVAVLAVGGIAVSTLSGTEATDAAAEAAIAKLPPYWTVKAGQTYSDIAEKTGLSVDQLEAFNPRTNPTTIRPGQRIKLRENVPATAQAARAEVLEGPQGAVVRVDRRRDGQADRQAHRAQQAPEARGAQARRPRAAAALSAAGRVRAAADRRPRKRGRVAARAPRPGQVLHLRLDLLQRVAILGEVGLLEVRLGLSYRVAVVGDDATPSRPRRPIR